MNPFVVLGMCAFTVYWTVRSIRWARRVDTRGDHGSGLDKKTIRELDSLGDKIQDMYHGPYGD